MYAKIETHIWRLFRQVKAKDVGRRSVYVVDLNIINVSSLL